jgi:hypothetical protein
MMRLRSNSIGVSHPSWPWRRFRWCWISRYWKIASASSSRRSTSSESSSSTCIRDQNPSNHRVVVAVTNAAPGGESVAVSEPCDVADVGLDPGSHDRADARGGPPQHTIHDRSMVLPRTRALRRAVGRQRLQQRPLFIAQVLSITHRNLTTAPHRNSAPGP